MEREKFISDAIIWISRMRMCDGVIIIPENDSLRLKLKEYLFNNQLPEQIRDAIIDRLCQIGRLCFKQLPGHRYCDHVSSPEALAFAISQGIFSSGDIKIIENSLDHNESFEKFKLSGIGLFDNVLSQLINKTEKPEFSLYAPEECFESH